MQKLQIIFRCTLIFCLSFFFLTTISAQDSSRLRISLLTCEPGDELYSTFGHSALRVVDSNSVTDIVYNYGTFNFNDEGFYLKFIRGQLRYYASTENFDDFKYNYSAENRKMTEQVLALSGEEKQIVRQALNENLREENKFYLYDFFLDNCTTRLRDIIVKYHKPAPQLPAVMPKTFTFRNAIHQYLDSNDKDWSKLGIDILLGAPTDAVMTTAQQQFLPDNLMYALDATSNTPIITSKQSLYLTEEIKKDRPIFTPLVFFASILLLFILVSFLPAKYSLKILPVLDVSLFFVIGLLGILLVLMWVATDHTMTKNNFNLLWAWPMHIVYAIYLRRHSPRVRAYSIFTAVFLLLLLCAWLFLEQKMNNALVPLVLLMIWRSGATSGFGRNH